MTFNTTGPEPNPRPQAARASQRRQRAGQLVGDGPQDEGHLPHAQPLQHGRHQEVPHRGVLGSHRGPAQCAEGFGRWICKCLLATDR